MMDKNLLGYWKRGNDQYWHIMPDKSMLINQPVKNYHYNGDAHIFFHEYDRPPHEHGGRVKITQEEWEAVKQEHIKRINEF